MPCQSILVVDDDEAIRGLLAEALSIEGLEVDCACDGLDALQRLEAKTYALIVSDLRMPRLDGAGLYHAIARRWPNMCQRMLFISGSMVVPEYADFLQATRPAMLHKPFDVAQLLANVREMLHRA